MRCKKCDGKGWYDNPRYPNPASWSYAGEPTIHCRKCKGIGFVIGNIKEVVELLQVIKNNSHNMYHREIDQCINVIEGSDVQKKESGQN